MTDIDDMLQGEGEQTPSASPAEKKTQGSEQGESLTESQQTPEEVEFNSLKGSTQERIKRILQEKKALQEQVELNKRGLGVPPAPGYTQPNPDVSDAVNKLAAVGIATDEKVNKVVDEKIGNLTWNFEIQRLESKYSGDDGRPKFDRDEYFDYLNRNPQYRNYLPEDVYSKMYSEELSDWNLANANKAPRTKTLRPTKATSGEEPLTPELIEQRLKEPDGRQWYERNIEKINRVLGKTG